MCIPSNSWNCGGFTNSSLILSVDARRSGRATKGVHKGLEETEPTPPPKKGTRGKKKQPEPQEEEEDAIIRCICGATTEDDDDEERTMIICEKCEAWQHNECMEVSTNPDELPDKYYCEQCKPQDHKELLKKIKKGEKPWEERQRQRALEEEEKRAKKGKGKRGRKGRPSNAQKEEVETNGALIPEEDSVMAEPDTVDDAKTAKDDVPPSPQVGGHKRKHQQEPAVNASSPSQSVCQMLPLL